jgi:hypothetical protein
VSEEVVAQVPSLSDPKVLYDITLRRGRRGTQSDELLCSCQAFYSWKKRGEKCWHLRVYESAARALDRCWTEHNTPDGFVCVACLTALLSAMAGVVKQRYVDKAEAKKKVQQARASKVARKKKTPKAEPTVAAMEKFKRRAHRDAMLLSNALNLDGDGVVQAEQILTLAMVSAWVTAKK